MRAIRRIVLDEAMIGAVFLLGAWYVYYLLAVWGLMDYFADGVLKEYVTGPAIHVELLIGSLGLAALMAVVNHLSEVPAIRDKPFGQIILLKCGFYLMGLLFLGAFVNAVFLLFIYDWVEMRALWASMSPRLLVSLGGMVVVSFFSLTFLLEVRRKVGPGNLWALFIGKYHRPREEARVFLFLDLKDSTTIAERLGHSRYSQFIRSCFQDLTEFVFEYRAQIYQFVGDEVVLTWPGKDPKAERRSLGLFFAFKNRLAERRDWYEGKYGFGPEFRGGVEEGLVTAAEVGDVKREIAFHGDALNTAARLLELSRDVESPVLVSGRVHEVIAREKEWSTHPQGEITLRGKTEPVSVYGVDWATAR
ncbi:MAG: adenylate/guanylate cyclase domain-containing protein [Gemmatimonadetes bacterium]|nr:adenylate/guanylate cyclase domain-containing protein [Gemmatimonadota bacterium]